MSSLLGLMAVLLLGVITILALRAPEIGRQLSAIVTCHVGGLGNGGAGGCGGLGPMPGAPSAGAPSAGAPSADAPADGSLIPAAAEGDAANPSGGDIAASLALDFTPIVGEIKGLIEVFTGRDLVTGEDLGAWRWAGLLGLIGLNEVRALRYGDDVIDAVRRGDDAADAARRGDDVDDLAAIFARCSFSPNTAVATPGGARPIAGLQVGEQVLAYNQRTGTVGPYPITAVWVHEDPRIVELRIDGETLQTTPDHPFFTLRGWQPAAALTPGQLVRNADGEYAPVQQSRVDATPAIMYNLSVAEANTFFVGAGRWLVHNDCFLPDPGDIQNAAGRSAATSMRNSITDHLTPSDLEGAWRDLNGRPVPDPRNPGRFYDHIGEVNNALTSLRNSMDVYRRLLADPRLSPGDRALIERYLSAASRTVDYVEELLSRPNWTPGARIPIEFPDP
jgi:hypothetical protein